MATQNNFRLSVPKLMYSLTVLYQNGEITTEEKNSLCRAVNKALTTNNFDDLRGRFQALRYGTMFPNIVDECIQLVSLG